MENKTILKVNNLQTEFSVGKKKVHAVNGVSFELKKGEILGIVGKAAAAKVPLLTHFCDCCLKTAILSAAV